jgi:hypothetical protein
MLIQQLMAEAMSEEEKGHNPIDMIFGALEENFPNPETADIQEVQNFIIGLLQEADLSEDEYTKIKERIYSVSDIQSLSTVLY